MVYGNMHTIKDNITNNMIRIKMLNNETMLNAKVVKPREIFYIARKLQMEYSQTNTLDSPE